MRPSHRWPAHVGIGFAIPINLAKRLVPELEQHGHVTRAWLGVTIQQVTPSLGESLGVAAGHGALVAQVDPEGPAAKSGIKPGDVITAYDGKPLDEHASLRTLVAATPVGRTVQVDIVRDGGTRRLEVKTARLADDSVRSEAGPSKGKWGLALRDLSTEEWQRRSLGSAEGVLVAGVAPGSPAADADLHPGDLILRVNRTPVGSVDELRREIAKSAAGKPLLLLVRRADGNDRFAALAPR